MASHARTVRRTAADWQVLVQQQRDSGLSAAAFCREHDLVYQSFVGQRRKLGADATSSRADRAALTRSLPGFVEIGVAEPDTADAPSANEWLVELDLGGGMQLRVRQLR